MVQSLDEALGKKHKSKLQQDQEAAKSRPSTAFPPRRCVDMLQMLTSIAAESGHCQRTEDSLACLALCSMNH